MNEKHVEMWYERLKGILLLLLRVAVKDFTNFRRIRQLSRSHRRAAERPTSACC